MLTQSYMVGEGKGQLLFETIGSCFDRVVAENAERTAVIVRHQGIRKTWSEFANDVDRLATGLIALGIKPGDRVGIWGPNSYEWVLTQFATAKFGAIMVCINPAYRLYELEFVLNKVGCKAIIAAEKFKTSDYLGMLNELAPELGGAEPGQLAAKKLPHLTTVIRMGEGSSAGMYGFAEVCDLGGDDELAALAGFKQRLKPDDAINIQFTSGYDRRAKGRYPDAYEHSQ